MSKSYLSSNVNLTLNFSQLLAAIRQLDIEQKIVIEKELEKDTLFERARRLSDAVQQNELTMNDIVCEVHEVRKERYGKRKK
ncbi:MAG: hypothetical protein KJ607_02345 [Bacteroidetes bacterium]|nr:hypothetical protein [Bacteroidota bacterium]